MEVDFDRLMKALELLRGYAPIDEFQRVTLYDLTISTLDAAKAEIARLHKVIDKDTTSLDDHIASEQRALKEVARLTALNEQQERAMVGMATSLIDMTEGSGKRILHPELIQARIAAAMEAAKEE